MLRDFAMSPALAARTAAWDGRPVPVRDAATVILVRDGDAGVEAFLQRRVAGMAFAAGMHVFPGGAVEARDGEPVRWIGPAADELVPDAGPEQAHAVVVAAIRETFEECGVLFAGRNAAGTGRIDDAGRAELAVCGLPALLAARGLAVRADLLRAWAHWVTPEFEPRRFDTWFFLAAVPPGQRPAQVGLESDRSGWLPAGAALDQADRGEVGLMPPTRVCLEELAAADSAADLLRTRRRPRRVQPRLAGGVLRVDIHVDLEAGPESAPR